MNKIKAILAATLVFAALFANAQTKVEPGRKTLEEAIKAAQSGDVLELTDGVYVTTSLFNINKDITVRAAKGTSPVITADRTGVTSYSFRLTTSCNVTFEGITFDGKPYAEGKTQASYAVIVKNDTDTKVENGSLTVKGCTFQNYNKKGGSPIRLYPNTLIDELTVENCKFINNHFGINCSVNAKRAETDTYFYNVAKVSVTNTLFDGLVSHAINYIANSDQSSKITLDVDHCVFNNVKARAISTRRVRYININNSVFVDGVSAFLMQGKNHKATNCCVSGSKYNAVTGGIAENIIEKDPKFEKGTFLPSKKSPLIGAATDGGNIGLIN